MNGIFLGVDLGHHSIVTASSSQDAPLQVTVDANGLSNRSTPSIVGIENNRILFGEEAETRLASVPTKIVHSIPARFGQDVQHGPFDLEGASAEIHLESSHLLSLFFTNYVAQVHPDSELKFVTISVPVGFSAEQVQVVVDAAHMSGLTEFDVIDHIDAALTLLSKDASMSAADAVIVVDCGFSQSSIGLMTKTSGVAKQSLGLSVSHLIDLIGSNVLMGKPGFLQSVKNSDQRFFFRLFKVCEKVLKDLSMLPSTVVDLGDFEESFERHLSPTEVKKLCRSSITVTREAFERELERSPLMAEFVQALSIISRDIQDLRIVKVEAVGGGSRVPVIAKTIASAFHVEQVGRGLDGSAFSALGAALWSTGKRGWSASRITNMHASSATQAAIGVQQEIQKIHDLEVVKLLRKNELEAYLYQVNSWLSDIKAGKAEIQAHADSVWSWFRSVEEGESCVSSDGSEFASKQADLKAVVEELGADFFAAKEAEKNKSEKSLTANAEYLHAASAHESAAEKRAKHADNATLSADQSIKLANKNKEEGNDLFKHGTCTDAMNRYMRALNILAKLQRKSLSEDEKVQVDVIALASNLNMAQCVVRMTAAGTTLPQDDRDGLLKRGVACAESALAIDPANAKAKYRKAVCLDRLRDTEQAKRVIDEALRENPDDVDLLALYDSLVATLKQQQSKAKKFFSKMFQ